MANYFEKYSKYKQKYLDLKKLIINNEQYIIGGNNLNLIGLLWLNKVFGPIQQVVDNNNLDIKQNIAKTYNKLKITYQNQNVILFLNFDKIIPEDIEWFNVNNIQFADVNQFETIKNNECLDKIYNPSKYNLEHLEKLPIYVQVDMTKILIQYEYMVYHNYDYVLFVDLDIKTIGDDLKYVICKQIRPDFTGELYPNKLLDIHTIKILDIFGYLVAGFSNPIKIGSREKIYYNYEKEDYGKPINFIKIDSKIYSLNSTNFENSFLISKKSENTIRAIKEYFIDYVFCNIIYNNYINNQGFTAHKGDPGFIYTLHYLPFFIYLHFLNQLIYIGFKLDIIIQDNIIFFNELRNKFIINQDYDYTLDENISSSYKIIKILNFNTFKFFTNKFGYPKVLNQTILLPYIITFTENYIPKDKLNLFLNNMPNIIGEFGNGNQFTLPIPYKCIGVEPSKNVNFTKY